MISNYYTKAIQLAQRVGGYDHEAPLKILDLFQFQGKEEVEYTVNTETNAYGYYMLDVTLNDDDKWALIEANGTNGALSSTAVNGENARVSHKAEIFRSKIKATPNLKCVVVFVHQHRFIHLAEFFSRAAKFAANISEDFEVALRSVDEQIGGEQVTVIAGEIAEVAKHISYSQNTLHYKGVEIILASNPNLIPELERAGMDKSVLDKLVSRVFQEQQSTTLIHDKALQQQIAEQSGFVALNPKNGFNELECIEIVQMAKSVNKVIVGKMNSGSGGTGVEFFTPSMTTDEINARFIKMRKSVTNKYGTGALGTMYPIRFFDFVKSKEASIEGKGHLWDLRMQVIARPGSVEIRPCVVRACPLPFDGSYERSTVVSNLSGRIDPQNLSQFMFKNPFHAESDFHLCLKIPPKTLAGLIEIIVKWSEKVSTVCV